MSKSRLSAFKAGLEKAQATKAERANMAPPPPSGNWARSAVEQMGEKIDAMRALTVQGILDGTLPIRVPADRIEDRIGSDRVISDDAAEYDTDSFRSLVENIRRRGLRVPLRVRPADPDWRPRPEKPNDIGDQVFVLQSGRRRLAACRELGIDPLVFLSFVKEGAERVEDLQERFFENTVRRDLTSFEKLWSIGLIAAELPEATQEQIAEIIGVAQSAVSRGTAVLKYREELERLVDPATATVGEIDAALASLREQNRSESPAAVRQRRSRERRMKAAAAPLPFRKREFGGTVLSLRANRDGGRTLTLKTSTLDDRALDRIAALVAELEGAEVENR